MASKIFNFIIMGQPGAGKGTICSKILKEFPFYHISVGDLLRTKVLNDATVGEKINNYMRNGALVPDELVNQILRDELNKHSAKSILFDGYPRTINQAELLKEIVSIDTVIALQIPHQVIIDRMSKRWIHLSSGRIFSDDYNPPKVKGFDDLTGEPLIQRDDDKPEIVKQRLENYERTFQPIIDFYRNQHPSTTKVKVFPGTESNLIYKDIQKFLKNEIFI